MRSEPHPAASSWKFPELIARSREGNKQALDRLIPLVYQELHAIASRLLRTERPNHTLRPTALINEAYLRFAESDLAPEDRAHFISLAARLMRQVLVDYARSQGAAKRGGNAARIEFDEKAIAAPDRLVDIVMLDDALTRLAKRGREKGQHR